MTLEEFLEKLKKTTYEYEGYGGRKESAYVISQKHFQQVESLIKQYLIECHTATAVEMGELKAKVYAYEAIIANSNFAPVLQAKTHNEVKNESEVANENDTQTDE